MYYILFQILFWHLGYVDPERYITQDNKETDQVSNNSWHIDNWDPARYVTPLASGIHRTGLPFAANLLPRIQTFINISQFDLTNFTFVTAADSRHFKETFDLVAGIQKHFPMKTIIYYSLGLSEEKREKVC